MKKIETEAEFESILLLEKAMVFIFFEWSAQAIVTRKTILSWEDRFKFKDQLFELDSEELPICENWLRNEVQERHGYGSFVWLVDGKIVDYEKDAGKLEFSELERKTSEIFGIV